MKNQANGIGKYPRKRPVQCAAPISAESQSRMDAVHRICQERANAGKTAAQAAAAYQAAAAGIPAQKVEEAA